VGVALPVLAPSIAATIAGPFIGPIGTSGGAVTPAPTGAAEELETPVDHRVGRADDLLQRGGHLVPAGVAPQLRMHDASAFQSIDPDLSWTIRMSGGSGAAPWFTAAQFESGLDALLASVRTEASMIGGVTVPAWPIPRSRG
jgi:hypothetical protein